MKNKLIYFILCLVKIRFIYGHGMMMEPVNRGSLWRVDPWANPDYDDDGSFCGGYNVQKSNKGKCGICGDNYLDPPPRAHELGGRFGKGKIVSYYRQGDVILVNITLTANHRGYFQFSICNIDDQRKHFNRDKRNIKASKIENFENIRKKRSLMNEHEVAIKLSEWDEQIFKKLSDNNKRWKKVDKSFDDFQEFLVTINQNKLNSIKHESLKKIRKSPITNLNQLNSNLYLDKINYLRNNESENTKLNSNLVVEHNKRRKINKVGNKNVNLENDLKINKIDQSISNKDVFILNQTYLNNKIQISKSEKSSNADNFKSLNFTTRSEQENDKIKPRIKSGKYKIRRKIYLSEEKKDQPKEFDRITETSQIAETTTILNQLGEKQIYQNNNSDLNKIKRQNLSDNKKELKLQEFDKITEISTVENILTETTTVLDELLKDRLNQIIDSELYAIRRQELAEEEKAAIERDKLEKFDKTTESSSIEIETTSLKDLDKLDEIIETRKNIFNSEDVSQQNNLNKSINDDTIDSNFNITEKLIVPQNQQLFGHKIDENNNDYNQTNQNIKLNDSSFNIVSSTILPKVTSNLYNQQNVNKIRRNHLINQENNNKSFDSSIVFSNDRVDKKISSIDDSKDQNEKNNESNGKVSTKRRKSQKPKAKKVSNWFESIKTNDLDNDIIFKEISFDGALETEECFKTVQIFNGDSKYYLEKFSEGNFLVKVQLPKDLVCDHCVFRWRYKAGNNWGICSNGIGMEGCGPQETFINCADISIFPNEQ